MTTGERKIVVNEIT